MYTQCPNCVTVYKLQAESLARARGRFRCGHCGDVFDGLERLVERLPEEGFVDLPEEAASATPVVLAVPAMRPARQPALHLRAIEAEPQPRISTFSTEVPLRPQRAPLRAEQRAPRREAEPTERRGRWGLGSAVLALLLGAQIAYAERQFLLQNDSTRPWLDRICDLAGCALPMRESLSDIRLVSRDVRPHPDAPKALLISASMVNDADFTQPFPIVEVTLSDLSNRPVAQRRFTPEEYLAEAASIARGFPQGSTAPLVFEVADPGQAAVAFEFRFLSERPPAKPVLIPWE
jgi:predicted Zn finger-like uncharacterized protein